MFLKLHLNQKILQIIVVETSTHLLSILIKKIQYYYEIFVTHIYTTRRRLREA